MITIKSPREIAAMKKSGEILASVHVAMRDFIKPGVTTAEINALAQKIIEDAGAKAAQIGFEGYKYATCTSVNDEICHGFPRKKPLVNGDLVKVDMCVDYQGAMSDSCWAYVVGTASPEVAHLMDVSKKSLYLGIEQAQIVKRLGDIGNAIETYVKSEHLTVVRDFVGHGIGPTIHEDPDVPAYGIAGKGLRLREGMVITIEPMVNIGTAKSKTSRNGWTASTRDGKLSCQYEHTLAITKDGPILLTSQGVEGTY